MHIDKICISYITIHKHFFGRLCDGHHFAIHEYKNIFYMITIGTLKIAIIIR